MSEVTWSAPLPRRRGAESSGLAAASHRTPKALTRAGARARGLSRHRRPRGRAGSGGPASRQGEIGATREARPAHRLNFTAQVALPGGEAGGTAPGLAPRDARGGAERIGRVEDGPGGAESGRGAEPEAGPE